MTEEKTVDKISEAAEFLKILGSSTRLNLLCHLGDKELCVTTLAELTGLRMPTVSQQLSLLRNRGIVAARKVGTMVYYRLVSSLAKDLIMALQSRIQEQIIAQDNRLNI